jgi:hypothetical protein
MPSNTLNTASTKMISPVALRIANVSLEDALWLTRTLSINGVGVMTTPRGKGIMQKLRAAFFWNTSTRPRGMQLSH